MTLMSLIPLLLLADLILMCARRNRRDPTFGFFGAGLAVASALIAAAWLLLELGRLP